MQFLMGDNGGETKYNFFGSIDRQASIGITKKKKKKRVTTKKKKQPAPAPSFIPDDQDF